jgi:cobalt-precorrin 5A hydrolase
LEYYSQLEDHGQKIHKAFKGSSFFVSKKIWQNQSQSKHKNQFDENIVIFTELSKVIQQQFYNFTGHVLIFSTGIAVKIIDPLLK